MLSSKQKIGFFVLCAMIIAFVILTLVIAKIALILAILVAAAIFNGFLISLSFLLGVNMYETIYRSFFKRTKK